MSYSVRDKTSAALGLFFLILSGSFYLFFRNHLFGAPTWPSMVKELTRNEWGRFVLYTLPNLFWVAAFLFFTELGTYKSALSKRLFQWSIPLFGAVQEIGQYVDFLDGTFDIADILGYLVVPIIYQTLKNWTHEK